MLLSEFLEYVPFAIAGGIVVGVLVLLSLLRRMRVRAKYLLWTVCAHAGFIILLGLTIAPTSLRSRSLDDEAMAVVMLPPILEHAEADPEESAFVSPPRVLRVVPPDELPEDVADSSRASRFLGMPTSPGLASARLRAIAPTENAAELGVFGVPSRRSDNGAIIGSSVSAAPSEMTSFATGDSGPMVSLEPRGERTSAQLYESRHPNARVLVAGPDTDRAGELGLPSGYSIVGDVVGREISYLPSPPQITGTDAGTLKVRFWVSRDGRVYDVNIILRSGYPKLEQEARRWVERIRFAPLDPSVARKAEYGIIEIDISKFR